MIGSSPYKRFLQEIYDSGKVMFVELDENQVEQHLEEISGKKTEGRPERKPGDQSPVIEQCYRRNYWSFWRQRKRKEKEEAKQSSRSHNTQIHNKQILMT